MAQRFAMNPSVNALDNQAAARVMERGHAIDYRDLRLIDTVFDFSPFKIKGLDRGGRLMQFSLEQRRLDLGGRLMRFSLEQK